MSDPLPEIPQAKVGFRLWRWAQGREKPLAIGAAFVVGLIVVLALVPLPEDDPPAADEAKAGPASLLSAVPRWLGALMRRSDPEALVLGEAGGPAAAGEPGRVSTRDYEVLRRRKGPAPAEAEAPQTVPHAELKLQALASSARAGAGARTAASPAAAPAGAAEAGAAATEGSYRAGASVLRAGGGEGVRSRQSRFSSGQAPARAAGGGRGAALALSSDAGGASGIPSAALKDPAPARGAPAPGVPATGRPVALGGEPGSGGGGGTSAGPGNPGKHPCLRKAQRELPGWRCRVLACLAPELREALAPALVVSMVTHGVKPEGAASSAAGDLLGGMIRDGSAAAAEFSKRADGLRRQVDGMRFSCAEAKHCEGLNFCRDYIVDNLGRASDEVRRAGDGLAAAAPECRRLPVGGDVSGCFSGLRQSAKLDRDASERVDKALKTALGEGERRCRSADAQAQARWDQLRKALAESLKPIVGAIEKPYCPDRLPCSPLGVSQLQESRQKVHRLANGLDGAPEDLSLPASASALGDIGTELDAAVRLLSAPGGGRGLNVFDGLEAADRATARLHGAAEAWNGALAACRNSPN